MPLRLSTPWVMRFVCKKIPQNKPQDFVLGERYIFAQERRVFVLYEPRNDVYRRTDIKIGYRQFRECFERV